MFWQNFLNSNPRYGFPTIIFLIFLIWLFVWKGYGLWRAAKNGQKYWFIAMLIVSSLGILEIIYLFFFQKEGKLSFKKIINSLTKITKRK